MANPRNITSLAALRESLSGVETLYVVDYQGLSAGQISKLRRQLREKGCQLIVAKNTLVRLALKDGGHDFADILHGPSAVVLADKDPAGAAQVLAEAAKGNDRGIPAAKAGLLNGVKIDAKTVTKIASLGTLQDQRALLVGTLAGHMSNFVGILEAYKEKLEQQSA